MGGYVQPQPNSHTLTIMAGYDIEQVLINEANRIGPDIYRKTLNTSPWLKLVKKDVWPDEMGDTIRVLTYERSLPANALSWSQISVDPVTGTSNSAAWYNNTTATAATQNTDGSYTTNAGGNYLPSKQVIQFAQTLRSYNLTQTALESPKLSVNDLRFSLKRKEQLSNIFAILQENTSYAWQDRYRNEYSRVAQNKISAAVDNNGMLIQNNGDAVSFNSTTLPTSTLVQGILDRVYQKLIRDGGGNNPLDRENARPVFGVILSSETSRNLIMANPDIRQDYRWSSKVNELLSPLGIERSYAGFFHMVDDWGPRWDAYKITAASGSSVTIQPTSHNTQNVTATTIATSAGKNSVGNTVVAAGQEVSGDGIAAGTTISTLGSFNSGTSIVLTLSAAPTIGTGGIVAGTSYLYVRRLPYAAVSTTQGYKFDIDPLYELAEFEDSIVFHQDVFTNLVPKPITAAGSNVTFDAVSYMGDFKWKNIITPDTNPDGTVGYFRAILSSGSKPIRPEWGSVIRSLRASTPLVLDGVYHGGANIIVNPVLSESSLASGQSLNIAG